MESAIVSASMGAVNPLLGKLSRLITEEHAKLKGRERKEVIISLKDEFGYMVALLRVSAMVHEPDAQVKEWMRQVREVAYDTEDCIDLFWHDLLRRELNFLDRVSLSPRARSKPKRLIKEMRQLLGRLVQASERRTRYNLVDGLPASDTINAGDVDLGSGSVTIDPLLLHMEEASPVAIGGPTSELVDRLMNKERHLRVVSIVGMAGIGKTTLAKKVYSTVMTKFDCQASVYVGRSPSIKTVLMDILQQVSRQEPAGTTLDEHEAMTQLRSFLANKRYLIIFDDIWSISAWKAINCALPGNDARSRIITTSRLHGVAKSCSNHPDDVTYVMKTLGESDSNRLFHSRIFGSEEKCQEECSEVHNNVSKICGGLPWSILVVASLVAGKHAEPGGWEMINKSTLEHYHPSKGMKKILHMSYADLTLPMKSCLLYLSVFPKNCTIRKDRLIWRWIAEGFIPVKGEECILDTGRSYFNELINRSLIQPVFGTDDDENDPIGCTIHDAVHDFVVSMSSEENFVTLEEEFISMPRDVVRRLSLDYAKQEDGTLALDQGSINNLSQVRSLTVSGCAQRMPHLANFLLLRVLDLEDTEGLESRSLEDIGRLFNLKYLGLGGSNVTELPESIGELRLLETLDVRATKVKKLPTSIARLQKIARLFAKVLDDIPDGIEKMQDLQELSMIIVNSRRLLNLVGALVKSRQLKVLGVKWCFSDELQGDVQTSRSDFVSSLNKVAEHSKLEHLYLRSDGKCSLNFLADSWVPPCLLQKLVVKSVNYYFHVIPKHLASCLNLTNLEIGINLDKEEDLSIIAHLPALIILKLSVKEKRLVIRKGFACLEVFWLECRDGAPEIDFLVGAMPKLRKLHLSFKLLPLQVQGGFHFGLRNLSSLKQVHAKIICDGASVSEVDSVERAMERDLSRHLNNPTLKLAKHNYSEEKVTMDEGRKSTAEKVNNS